jgi:hypothetical protein
MSGLSQLYAPTRFAIATNRASSRSGSKRGSTLIDQVERTVVGRLGQPLETETDRAEREMIQANSSGDTYRSLACLELAKDVQRLLPAPRERKRAAQRAVHPRRLRRQVRSLNAAADSSKSFRSS